MKILIEKINSKPGHSISNQEVRDVIDIVPDDWIRVGHTFSISAQLFENSGWDRPVIQNNTTFRILSRGLDRKLILRELLIELAIKPTGNYPAYRHQLTKYQRKK